MSIAPMTREQQQMLNRAGIRWEGSRGPMGGGGPMNLNFLTRQFNQGGFGRYGGQQRGPFGAPPQFDLTGPRMTSQPQQPYRGGPQGSRNPWMQRQQGGQMGGVDPRRAQRDPRWQRGAHPQQGGGQPGGWMSPYRNALMQRFQRPSWAPQSAQGYRMGNSYMQGQGSGYAPPPTPQQQFGQRFRNFFDRQVNQQRPNQPTAPRTMGKPTGRSGRMY